MVVGLIALVVVVVVVVAAALVLPALFAPSRADSIDVADIHNEPKATWTFDWMGENDSEFVGASPETAPIGDGRALVWTQFEYSNFLKASGNSGWYPGYDEQYDLGFDAGTIYASDVDAYNADTYPYTVPTPRASDYFPPGAYNDFIEYRGFHDGFDDAKTKAPAGTSRREAPEAPNYTPTVVCLDTTNGEALWSVNLAEVVDGVDYSTSFRAQDVEGSNAVAIFIATYGTAVPSYAVLTLDKSTGAVLSQLATPGPATAVTLDGDLVVIATDATAERSRIARYDVDELAGDAKWAVETEPNATIAVGEGYVIVYGIPNGTVLNGANGSTAGWGDDISASVGYTFVGSDLLRVEATQSPITFTLRGWSTRGEPTWSESVTVSLFTVVGGNLLALERADDGYSQLQRIDPATGSVLWTSTFGDPFDKALGSQADTLLLRQANSVIVVDLATGDERFRQNTAGFGRLYEGATLYYAASWRTLAAYRYDASGEVWTFALTAGQTATAVGGRLVIVDAHEGTLIGLAG